MSIIYRSLFKRATETFRHNLPFHLAAHTPPYHERTLDACLGGLKSGAARLNISLLSSHGKSTFIVNLLSRIPSPASNSSATRSLVIVDDTSAAEHLAVHFAILSPMSTLELEDGQDNKCRGTADIVIATSDTLRSKARLRKFNLSKLKAVVINSSYKALDYRLLSHFEPDLKRRRSRKTKPEPLPHQIAIIGFSSSDSHVTANDVSDSIFQRTIHPHSTLEMMQEHWSCKPRFTSIVAEMNLRTVSKDQGTGDFLTPSLAVAVNKQDVNTSIVQAWSDHAGRMHHHVTRRRSVDYVFQQCANRHLFCLNAAHAEALAHAFEIHGLAAKWISAETPVQTLKDILAQFNSGLLPVLVNGDVLFQDADIANVDCVVIGRPTLSLDLFARIIRYGTRPSSETGKEDCLIMDLVDSAARTPGIICTATVFGLDPTEVTVNDESTQSLKELAHKLMSAPPEVQPYETRDNPFYLVDEGTGDPHLAELSEYSWVASGDDHYSLRCYNSRTVVISPVRTDNDLFFEAEYISDDESIENKKLGIFTKSLPSAIKECDAYVVNEVVVGDKTVGYTIPRSAEWRTEPSTRLQKRAVLRTLVNWAELYDPFALIAGVETVIDMTRGEASNIIDRLKAGALARYEFKRKASSSAWKN